MNPMTIMKLTAAKNKFVSNHPKFSAFMNKVFSEKIEAGTTIEITVQRPGEDPLTSNLRVQQSDLELLQGIKDLMSKQ